MVHIEDKNIPAGWSLALRVDDIRNDCHWRSDTEYIIFPVHAGIFVLTVIVDFDDGTD